MINAKKKIMILSISVIFAFAVGVCAVMFMRNSTATALAETVAEDAAEDEFIVTDTSNEVLATYAFARLNDTDCSVKISNKTVATKAVIPSTVEIDGAKYRVTEIAANGFMSATKLTRVSLPATIEKINNMAFYNCAALTRISLANVKVLGNNVFYGCKSLTNLVLPKSVESVGTTILRNCTTKVRLRAQAVGEAWSATWNSGNAVTEPELGSTFKEPLELETVYGTNTNTRSAELILEGYTVADGQPRTDSYYFESDMQDNVFIPNMYNGEYILGISNAAFDGTAVNQLIIEYSSLELAIGSCAFVGIDCNSIVINRDIIFSDPLTGEASDNIFTGSTVQKVVLPDTVVEFPMSMFADCTCLTNIYFHTPVYIEKREDMLNVVEECASENAEGIVHLLKSDSFETISDSAFDGTVSIAQIHIYDNVKNIGNYVFGNWESSQEIYIHNENINFTERNGYDWALDWMSGSQSSVIYGAVYHTITFDPANGDDKAVKDVKMNAKIGELPEFEYRYHVLDGWYDIDGNAYDKDTVYNADSDITLYAKWNRYKYYVEYKSNRPDGASSFVVGDMENSEHEYGVSTKLSDNMFTLIGWHFIGWNTDESGNGVAFDDGQAVETLNDENNGVVVLYAQWACNTYTVEYVPNKPASITGEYDVEGAMPDSFHKYDVMSDLNENAYTLKGWRFTCWNTKSDGSGTPYSDGQQVDRLTPFDGNVAVLYAQWELVNYEIYLYPDGYYGAAVLYGLYNVETPTITFEAWAGSGYIINWAPQSIPQYSTGIQTISGNKTYIEYKIKYVLNGGNYAYDLEKLFTVLEPVIFKEPTKENHLFGGWVCDGEWITDTEGFVKDITVEAVWTVDPVGYDVTANTTAKTVTHEYSLINMPQMSFRTSCHVTVSSSVKWLTIKSAENITFNMYITVGDRYADLELHLENFTIKAPNNTAAITMTSPYTLNLYTYDCEIYGGSGYTAADAVKADSGSVGIICYDLTVHSSGTRIYGGSGGQGVKGKDGSPIGGMGGTGGTGGCAVFASGNITILASDVLIQGGVGGKG